MQENSQKRNLTLAAPVIFDLSVLGQAVLAPGQIRSGQ
jgi:hypothetical protein